MNVRRTLVDLFSRHRCEEVDKRLLLKAFREDDFDSVMALPDYPEEYNRVRRARRRIEFIEDGYDNEPQVLQSLAELKSVREKSTFVSEDYKVARELIEKILFPTWGDFPPWSAPLRRDSTSGESESQPGRAPPSSSALVGRCPDRADRSDRGR